MVEAAVMLTTRNRYVVAQGWPQLARAVQSSTTGSSMDELIQVVQEGKPSPKWPIKGVRFVHFEDHNDIFSLLTNRHSLPPQHLTPFSFNVNAPEFVPRPAVMESSVDIPPAAMGDTGAHEPVDQLEELGQRELDEEEFKFEPSAEAGDTEALARSDARAQETIPPSEQELKAASVIQGVYRRTLRRGVSQDGLAAIRAMHFKSYLIQAKEMEWPYRCYRLLFLGPIPHLFVCLDAVLAHMRSSKNKLKKRLRVAQHEELEELSQQQTQVK
jgi:hypothetical protein